MSSEFERTSEKAKVFISYSRADGSALADELVPGLELAGVEPFIDKQDIEKAVDWEDRLGNLILRADFIVFIITPASIRSERCQWEVNRAVELGKRIIPVQWIKVDEAYIPTRLKRLNYVIFEKGQSFARPLAELVAALRQDVEWIRTHTVLGEQAARWKDLAAISNADDLLLRGSALAVAQRWMAKRLPDAPEITDLQRTFIDASHAAEAARLHEEQLRSAERDQFAQEVQLSQKRGNYARITMDAISFPSRVSPLIKFGDNASLKSALFFWFAVSLFSIFLNSIALAALGIEVSFGDLGDNSWLKFADFVMELFKKYQIAAALVNIAIYLGVGIVWYLGIRCLVSGEKLPFSGFFQCLAYPAAAVPLVYLPFTTFGAWWLRELYSSSFDAMQILATRPEILNDPGVRELCSNTASFACKMGLVNALHLKVVLAQQLGSFMLLGWIFLNTSTIIKGVAGLSRRRTLSGLLISIGVSQVILAGILFFYVLRTIA